MINIPGTLPLKLSRGKDSNKITGNLSDRARQRKRW